MNGDPIGISAIGLASALGLDAVNACAAARAGINRLQALQLLNWAESAEWGGEPVAGHSVPLIAEGFVGVAKAFALAQQALQDMLPKGLAADQQAGTSLFLVVSDAWLEDGAHRVRGASGDLPSLTWRVATHRLVQGLLRAVGLALPAEAVRIYHGHHAELVDAFGDAAAALAAGRFQRCIVGAVDSALEPRRLLAAAQAELVKTAVNPVGHLPGEGAGFVLLEAASRAAHADRPLRARLAALGRGGPRVVADAPVDGRALADALKRVLGDGPGWFVVDLNGEVRRAQEWGTALVHLQAKHAVGDWPVWFPALSFGETGTVAGLMGIAMTLHSWARGYAPAGVAVLPLASDNGARAALALAPV